MPWLRRNLHLGTGHPAEFLPRAQDAWTHTRHSNPHPPAVYRRYTLHVLLVDCAAPRPAACRYTGRARSRAAHREQIIEPIVHGRLRDGHQHLFRCAARQTVSPTRALYFRCPWRNRSALVSCSRGSVLYIEARFRRRPPVRWRGSARRVPRRFPAVQTRQRVLGPGLVGWAPLAACAEVRTRRSTPTPSPSPQQNSTLATHARSSKIHWRTPRNLRASTSPDPTLVRHSRFLTPGHGVDAEEDHLSPDSRGLPGRPWCRGRQR